MKKDILTRIGDICRNLRGQRSQEEIAKKSNVSRNIISNIENGKNYEAKNLAKVITALGAELDSLFSGLPEATADEKRLHEKLHELLHTVDPWPTVASYNVNSVYLNYVATEKGGGPSPSPSPAPPSRNRRSRRPLS